MTQVPRRADSSVRAATHEASTEMSMAELPIPTTSTTWSHQAALSRKWCACTCSPVKVDWPG